MAFTFNATRRALATVALALVLFLGCSWAAPTTADRVASVDRLRSRNAQSSQVPNQHLRSGRPIATLKVKLSECPNKEGLQELQEKFQRDEQLNNRLIKDFGNEYIVVDPSPKTKMAGRIPSRDYSVQCNSKSEKCGSDAAILPLKRTVLILQGVDEETCEYEITVHDLTVGCYCNKKDADITASGPKDQQ